MKTNLVDGRAIAQKIQNELQAIVHTTSRAPRLDILVVGENPVTWRFVHAKKRFGKDIGVEVVEHAYAPDVPTEKLIESLTSLVDKTDGIVVQLPLPESIDASAVLAAIPPSKDVDVLGETTFTQFLESTTSFVPPVAGAVLEILTAHNVVLKNAQVVVIGKGKLVGEPVAVVLKREGASVTVLDSKTSQTDFENALAAADVVVSGAGVPNLVQSHQIREGVVLIDAGTSSAGQTVMGDIARECGAKAKLFSTTPGGVGPITVAVLFHNLVSNI